MADIPVGIDLPTAADRLDSRSRRVVPWRPLRDFDTPAREV